jgi:triosephosphate isomerase
MKALVIANWKMNPATFREAKKIFEMTKKAALKARGVSVVVLPPTIFLRELSALGARSKVPLGVQHAHFEAGGSHTGEVSLPQARDAKAAHVLIGHAERRAAGETNDDTRRKVAATLAAGMTPILCVGEEQRTANGDYYELIREQLKIGLKDVVPAKLSKLVIAYEPVWAIGKDTAMLPRDMHEMSIFLRKSVVETHGEEGHNLKILYGGSVDDTNATDMLKEADVKGLLVGRASLDATKFPRLLLSLATGR